jgi:hypothetical protein
MLRGDVRGQFVGMSEPLATIERQGKGERAADIIGIGWRERGEFVGHVMDPSPCERTNQEHMARAACHSGTHSFMLADMPDHRFRTLERLIRQANQASSRKPDSIQMLAEVIRLVTEDGADPYLVIGVLIEGAVHTVARHIPVERQAETTEQLGQLLVDRLKARGLA